MYVISGWRIWREAKKAKVQANKFNIENIHINRDGVIPIIVSASLLEQGFSLWVLKLNDWA